MTQQRLTLLKSLKVLMIRLFLGQVHFPKTYVGKILAMADGKKFHVFRNLKVDPQKHPEKSAAVFKVRFKFSSLPPGVNKRLSLFPAPFLIARPGFLQKIWTFSEDGYFQGIYQWASREQAETYPDSFIFKVMTKRSAEGSLTYEVIPDLLLSEYIENVGPHDEHS
ncbi:hypothetical protein ACFL27_04250 [candidate division CSSED10-310 bacterium]|uniref:Uncharacterized protein n=1 Tax=candidate division CSSED10-310 bacterium TaxID=2855610 RepID=A0ABV6YT67_UNCC1